MDIVTVVATWNGVSTTTKCNIKVKGYSDNFSPFFVFVPEGGECHVTGTIQENLLWLMYCLEMLLILIAVWLYNCNIWCQPMQYNSRSMLYHHRNYHKYLTRSKWEQLMACFYLGWRRSRAEQYEYTVYEMVNITIA